MRDIKWIELGKFVLGLILVLLLIIVPDLLLQPLELSQQLQSQEAIVTSLSGNSSVPDPVHNGPNQDKFDYYHLSNGQSVVFLPAELSRRTIDLAVLLSKDGLLQDCRIQTALLPPATQQLHQFAALVKSGKLHLPTPDLSILETQGIALAVDGSRDFSGFVAALNRAVEISRKAGK